MKKRKILWGLYFIAAAVAVLLNGLGIFGEINSVKLITTMLLIPVFISGIISVSFVRLVFPVALGLIIYRTELGIDFSAWPILAAALLLTVGLWLIFPKKYKFKGKGVEYKIINEKDGDKVTINSRFNGTVRYIDSNNFTFASVDGSFSGIKIFFDKAVLNPEGGVINVNLNFSGLELYVPRTWNVIDNIDCSLGGVSKTGECIDSVNAPVLTLCGKVNFSGVTIKYI